MRVFVAGATGALGRPVVRQLVAAGHDVIGLTRSPGRRGGLEAMGARPVVADALDAPALARLLRDVHPSHVVHPLTALPPEGPLRSGDLHETNVLRRTGTANLVAAAVEAGAQRLVAESFPAVYGRDFDVPAVEAEALAPQPPRGWGDAVAALRSLEAQLLGARREGRLETVSMRVAGIYGPDVASTVGMARRLRRRQVFVPTAAPGVISFVHADDAASAIVAPSSGRTPPPSTTWPTTSRSPSSSFSGSPPPPSGCPRPGPRRPGSCASWLLSSHRGSDRDVPLLARPLRSRSA